MQSVVNETNNGEGRLVECVSIHHRVVVLYSFVRAPFNNHNIGEISHKYVYRSSFVVGFDDFRVLRAIGRGAFGKVGCALIWPDFSACLCSTTTKCVLHVICS